MSLVTSVNNGRMGESVKEVLEEEGSSYETRYLQSYISGLTRCSGDAYYFVAMELLQKHTVHTHGVAICSMTVVNMLG